MWWRKRKEKPVREINLAQERAVRKVAEMILTAQHRWASWMGSWFNKLPIKWQKGFLMVFILLVTLILIWPFFK